MGFHQTPPSLGNQYHDDRVLRSYLRRTLPSEMLAEIEAELEALGALAGGSLYELQLSDRTREPTLTQWDAWGHRIDRIEVTPLWQRAATLASEYGLIGVPYARKHGALSRVDQFARVHLFHPSTDVYTCPLAMTDGATKTLLAHGNEALIARAVERLTSRDPHHAWTSGQWMTERTGGSDVGLSETVARRDGDQWRLYGTKWFTSATTSQMALTLARPEGNPAGGRGLALFFVETRDAQGRLQNIQVNRLKDKLGTRKVPTAELTLDGTPAVAVAALQDGTRAIAPMLNITRTWNAVCATSGMRRAVALARSFAARRVAFGAPLSEKPLHLDTLAGLAAEAEAGFHLTFRAVELLGKEEAKTLTPQEEALLRLLTPIVKLTTGKMAVQVASEAIESFGGAGYVEDTGLPTLLRDAQVLPIWEGTTNVLSLDTLRAIGRGDALTALVDDVNALVSTARDPRLAALGRLSLAAVDHAADSARTHFTIPGGEGLAMLEADARRIALTLGRGYALALTVRHAQWSLDHEHDPRSTLAAARFARHGIDLLDLAPSLDENRALALDAPLAP
ncbi:MAG: acyl-CoA dehydrogenase family protein [Myxococcales bacterium]|nr:acyl-CoA dehydrogenase family protein [Myxococcales bacterium]